MAARRFLAIAGLGAVILMLGACGFRPIYATTQATGAALSQRIAIRQVTGPEAVAPLLTKALEDRMAPDAGKAAKYDLYVSATETAQRLAVQIDASVTRYNYRLNGRYTLLDLDTGERINGRARAVTSFNIVSSQYSTLYAERAAQEKAARLLAEEIERDLLIRFASEDTALEDKADADEAFLDQTEKDFLPEIRREIERKN